MPRFTLSTKFFSGFTREYNLDEVTSLEDVIELLKQDLLKVLEENGMIDLVHEAKKMSLHYHDYTLLDVLSDNLSRVWYICDGNH